MSYAVHPYAVSITTVKKCMGSRKTRLPKKLAQTHRDDFAEIDELDEDTVPMEKALSQMVMGEKLDRSCGYKYGYALKALCEHFGEMLTNRHWSALGWDWIEDVDKALAQLGVNEKVLRVGNQLLGRGAPVELPRIDDFPSIGYLFEAEIAKAAVELARFKDADIKGEEIRDSVGEIRLWLDHCTRSHKDLVCFYH